MQSDNIIVLAERFEHCVRVYYEDGHSEVVFDDIKTVANQRKKRGYKNAILLDRSWLYPTRNQKDDSCCWINLHYFKNANAYCRQLLTKRNLYPKAKMMYMKQIQKDINTYDARKN